MSYDLVVFSGDHVPRDKSDFVSWFHQISGTEDDFRFPKPDACVPRLQEYFEELKSYLPWHEEEPEAPGASDYSFGRYLIHCAFPRSSEKRARDTVFALCWRLQVGLYDIGGTGEVVYPEAVFDIIQAQRSAKRPWWKVWRP